MKERGLDRGKSNVLSNLHSGSHVLKNSLENENTFLRNNFVLGGIAYSDAAKSVKRYLTGHRQNCVAIFGNTISQNNTGEGFT